MYTVSQKTGPFLFELNFGKYCPILLTLSLLQQQTIGKVGNSIIIVYYARRQQNIT